MTEIKRACKTLPASH